MDCVSYTIVFLKPVQCMTYIYVESTSEGIISMKCKSSGNGMEHLNASTNTTNVTFLGKVSDWKQLLEISIWFSPKEVKSL